MRKFTKMAVLTALLLVVLAMAVGCGKEKKKSKDEVATASDVSPVQDIKVTKLADYKGFTYDKYTGEVTEKDINDYISQMSQYYSAYGEFIYKEDSSRMGTEVKKDDVLDIDFVGYVDGKEFDGGKGSTKLKIGSGKFIPGFEDELIGAKVGEKVDINVTFPDPYQGNTDLSGKPAVFSVTIKSCGTDEKLTDENLHEYLGMKDHAELTKEIKEYLSENPPTTEENYIYQCKEEFISELIKNSEFEDLTDDIDKYYAIIYGIMEESAKSYGVDPETLVTQAYQFESLDAYKKQTKENAERQVKQSNVLEKIGEAENIVLTVANYDKVATEIISNVTEESLDSFSKNYDEKYGNGAFRKYVYEIYVLDKTFEKYAKER